MSPAPLQVSRMHAVRRLLVDNLAGTMPNGEFVRVIPTLCAQLAPHVRAEPVARDPRTVVDRVPVAAELADRLTDREVEVVALAAAGLTNARIGVRLGISDSTVKTHVKRAFVKLGVHDRAAAVAAAIRRGIIT